MSRLSSPIPPSTTNTAASSSLAGCLPGSGTSENVTGYARPLDALPHLISDGRRLRSRRRGVVQADAHLVERVVPAQVLQRVERHVGVEPAEVVRGRRSRLVRQAGNGKVMLLPSGSPDPDRLAGGHVHQPQRGPLEGHLALTGREGARLASNEVDPLALEVGQRREQHLPRGAVVREQPDHDAPPPLGVVHAGHAPDHVHELAIEAHAGEQRGGGGTGRGEPLLQVAPEERLGPGRGAHGERPDRDRRDDERGACAVLAQVAPDLPPAHADRHGWPPQPVVERYRLTREGIE